MAIPEGYKANFNTMVQAADDGMLALVECTRKADGEKIYVICAVNYNPDEKEGYELIPVAKLFDGNPYEEVIPPGHNDVVRFEEDNDGLIRSAVSGEVRGEGAALQPTDDPAP
jgi:hypothetical protein